MTNQTFFQGNWVDLVIVIFLLIYLAEGLRKGFVYQFFSFVGFVAAFAIALRTYSFFGGFLQTYFSLSYGIANGIGFVVSGFLFEIILSLLIFLIIRKPLVEKISASSQFKKLNFLNHFLGSIPSLMTAFVILAFILTSAVSLPIRGDIKKSILSSKLGAPIVDKTRGVEREFTKIFGGVIEDSLTFITIKPHGEETIDLKFTEQNLTYDVEAENLMFVLLNLERAKTGVNLLEVERGKLTEIARKHGEDMFQRGYFSHINTDKEDPFARLDEEGVKYLAAAENLAYAPDVEIAHKGLMESESHRENILNPVFEKAGIGVIDAGIYGKMFVQVFSD